MRATTRRVRHVAAIATAAALTLLAIPSAATAAIAGNPYTIDGVVPDSTSFASFPDPFTGKELGPINSNATKLGDIHTAPKPMLGYEAVNDQNDLKTIWIDSTKAASGDIWLYLGWERDTTQGSGFVMYEFQQAPKPAGCDYSLPAKQLIAGCNPFENRQPGDFIIVWDQSGNANTVGVRSWTYTDANGNGVWDKATEPLVLGPMTTLTGSSNAEAMMSADR